MTERSEVSTTDEVTSRRAMTSETRDGHRVYLHPATGEEFRSVTTILGAAAKPALDKWKTKTIATFAAENRETLATMEESAAFELVRSSQFTASGASAATGEAVHSRLELLFRWLQECQSDLDPGDPASDAEGITREWMSVNPPAPELAHVDTCFGELLDEYQIVPQWMEATLFNREVGYAGSADLIAMIRPRAFNPDSGGRYPWKRAVIDAKSGKSIYGSVALQLVAYAKAEAILFSDGTEIPMKPIHETYALHVRPRSWALRPMRYDAVVWERFKSLHSVYQWLTFEERDAVGDAINAGAIARKRSYNARYSEGVRDAA